MKMRSNLCVALLVFLALMTSCGLYSINVHGQTNDSIVTNNSTIIMQSIPLEPIHSNP